ncbi:MAG: aspartate:alanine exchanger family transporter [Alphaproteobacteria bacterium]
MEIDLYSLLQGSEVLVIFSVITLGYLIGKINLWGVALGNVTGVLLAGLMLGSWGFTGNPQIATFGFTIFIFCVGLQAGPSFFSAFASDGARYFMLSALVAAIATSLCVFYGNILSLNAGFEAGMLAGALTSTPTLVGAQDAVSNGIASLPENLSAEDVIKNISVAYSLTYLFGVGGLLISIKYIPVIFNIDLIAEAKKITKTPAYEKTINENNLPMVRTYLMRNGRLIGKAIKEVQEASKQYFTVLGIRRAGVLIDVNDDTIIEENDVISVIASVAQHNYAKTQGVPEVFDRELLNYRICTKEITITNSDYVGKKVWDLRLPAKHGCFVIGMMRSGVELPVSTSTVLQKGDRLEVIGEENRIETVSAELGSVEEDIEKTDLLTLCLGVSLGLLFGTTVFRLGHISVSLGSAGGLLIVGILIGFFRSIHPTFGSFPRAARNIMMDLGILLFMSSIGLNAGEKVISALTSIGPVLILCGTSITILPVLIAFIVGRYGMKMNAALLLGAITGAMTSTPSLNMVTESAKSQIPALGYAGSYTFANVILTFTGALLVLL